MSYESPIRIMDNSYESVSDAISKHFAEGVDNLIVEAVVNVGVHVDKDELEKALRYDRGQYEKGYEDGKRDAAPRWVRCEEEPPKEEYRTYLVYTDTGYMCSCRWTNNMYGLGESDRWGWSIADVPQFQKVTHWMPIEPPKEDA